MKNETTPIYKWEQTSFYKPSKVEYFTSNRIEYIRDLDDDTFYSKSDNQTLFDTEEEARNAYREKISRVRTEEVKNYISFLYDEGDFSFFSDNIKRIFLERKSCFTYREREIIGLALRGQLNIGGFNFPVTQVAEIQHFNDKDVIILKDGKELNAKEEVEYFILNSIFGNNESRLVFK